MDYAEAKNVIKNTYIQFARCHGRMQYVRAMETAVFALEKQIPKEPTHEATLYKCLTCPTCKNVIDEFTEFAEQRVRVRVAHCKYCGQALDWGV